MITWLPWIFCVCSQMSCFCASLQVRRSFCRLLRPTRISNPSDERKTIGFDAGSFHPNTLPIETLQTEFMCRPIPNDYDAEREETK